MFGFYNYLQRRRFTSLSPTFKLLNYFRSPLGVSVHVRVCVCEEEEVGGLFNMVSQPTTISGCVVSWASPSP